MKRLVLFCASIFFTAFTMTCGKAGDGGTASAAAEKTPAKLIVAVSILPEAFFTKRIAAGRNGGTVEVMTFAGEGKDPHGYEVEPGQLALLSKAAFWITAGVEFEIGLKPKIEKSFASLKIVDGTAGVNFRYIEEHAHEGEAHESEAEESSGLEIDRHCWLGLQGATKMAENIRDALIAVDAENLRVYTENCEKLTAEMSGVFDELRVKLASLRGKTVFVYHPAFGYFLDDFGIKQEAVETGGKEPTARMLAALVKKAKAENVKTIFVQAQFPAESARALAGETGAEIVALDPLAEDWLSNIRAMGEAMCAEDKK